MRGNCVSLPSSLTFSTAWPMAGTSTSRYSRLWPRSTNKDPSGEQYQVNNNYHIELHCELFPRCHCNIPAGGYGLREARTLTLSKAWMWVDLATQ